MARNVYSLRIFAHGGLTSSGGKVGPIVPSGMIYIVRDIDALEITGTRPASFFAVSAVNVSYINLSVPVGDVVGNAQWRGRQVFEDGEQVGFQATAGTWSVMVSGYMLSLP